MIVYAATIFLSAFLLFQVQPLIAKIILPWFGGSAAVWSAALLFFQIALLAGYAYAHCVIRYTGARAQLAVHVVLLGASCALLPILPSPGWRPTEAGDPTGRILLALAATVGLPYFLLSATSPLLQAWYVRRVGGPAPYRLFALSNVGSLLGLVSFPFLVEPWLTSHQQAYAWSAGYVLFALLCAGTAWESRKEAPTSVLGAARAVSGDRPRVTELLLWFGLAACASTLLLAVTHHLSQDLAPIPLLWVVPLAAYLVSFILAFESDRVYRRWIFLPLLPPALALIAVLMYPTRATPPLQVMIPAFVCGLFVCCMVCHGELARRKPAGSSLTLFYLAVSGGGALGGLFVAVVAPRVFHTYLELPVGLVACAALAAVVVWNVEMPRLAAWAVRLALVCGVGVLTVSLARQEYLHNIGYRLVARNFYGVLWVRDLDDPRERILWNGTTVHGAQLLDPGQQYRATTSYGPNSGVGRALRTLEARGPLRVGLVGLGAGVLSTYGRAGDVYRVYEINPLVAQIAQTEFTFFAHTRADKRILLGDGRLVLERQESQQFDLLAIDAFSSDAIPIHLLTREALGVYFRHLKPGGVLALHVSNRYLDLVPVVARGAQEFGRQATVIGDDGHLAGYLASSVWVLVTSDTALFTGPSFVTATMAPAAATPGLRAWTDDYSSVFHSLAWGRLPGVFAHAKVWGIVSGQSVGPVSLGADIRDVVAMLGPPLWTATLPNGSADQLWYAAPFYTGLGVRTTRAGRVYAIWVQNDASYITRDLLHTGSTEAQVRRKLGAPTRESINSQRGSKTLWYTARGVWFNFPLDAPRTVNETVFAIGVMRPSMRPR